MLWKIEDRFGEEDGRRFESYEEAKDTIIEEWIGQGVNPEDINWDSIGIVECEEE